jgi:hypothetical protein
LFHALEQQQGISNHKKFRQYWIVSI